MTGPYAHIDHSPDEGPEDDTSTYGPEAFHFAPGSPGRPDVPAAGVQGGQGHRTDSGGSELEDALEELEDATAEGDEPLLSHAMAVALCKELARLRRAAGEPRWRARQ